MYKNYIKTALRNMSRSKLFTGINIIGLAISMSVGLLMILFISDLLSYDDFHEKKDNIYRVITKNQGANGHTMTLASSSIKAGHKIKETISGIEELTQVRDGFGGDAQINDSKVPLGGLYADNSFLQVFTFPLLEGDIGTALQEPYSLVLTEKSAKKLFGETDALGKTVKFDSLNYTVTGVVKDIPKLSHLNFESLASFATVELEKPNEDGAFLGWQNFFDNYTYALLPKNQDVQTIQSRLDVLSKTENESIKDQKITLSLQPLDEISIGKTLVNEIGPHVDVIAIWVLMALTCIVLLSACFNYTNLSVARGLKRTREVGIRKVIGAKKGQIFAQFVTESIVISLFSLAFSFALLLFLKDQFLALHPYIGDLVLLEISKDVVISFVALALFIGLLAGILPALFFSRTKPLSILQGFSSVRLFRKVNLRKGMIVVQYVFSLIFITTTIIGYNQYKSFIAYDLGFSTENILNIGLQGNDADVFIEQLSEIPAVTEISQSRIITSLGNIYGTQLKYNDPNDSVMARQNVIDEKYLPMHGHKFLSGNNFRNKSVDAAESEVIVNEKLLKRFNIGGNNPDQALGEKVTVDGTELIIIGVLQDFHIENPMQSIEPAIMRYSPNPGNYLNVKISSNDWSATSARIEKAWKQIDNIHPLDAKFYEDQIEYSYGPFFIMIKVIGFLAFLAICISALGLLGMVVFTTETKIREISIRKVLGAAEANLVYLLSKNFLVLLLISAGIALPVTYLLFEKVILTNFAYHQSIGFGELLAGFLGVLLIAIVTIVSRTFKAARTDPAKILRDE
jgi:ABC-type antimicrobial peptide transport system permease subunit